MVSIWPAAVAHSAYLARECQAQSKTVWSPAADYAFWKPQPEAVLCAWKRRPAALGVCGLKYGFCWTRSLGIDYVGLWHCHLTLSFQHMLTRLKASLSASFAGMAVCEALWWLVMISVLRCLIDTVTLINLQEFGGWGMALNVRNYTISDECSGERVSSTLVRQNALECARCVLAGSGELWGTCGWCEVVGRLFHGQQLVRKIGISYGECVPP